MDEFPQAGIAHKKYHGKKLMSIERKKGNERYRCKEDSRKGLKKKSGKLTKIPNDVSSLVNQREVNPPWVLISATKKSSGLFN